MWVLRPLGYSLSGGKAAMTEHLADPSTNLPNEKHFEAYKETEQGILGLGLRV